MSSNQATQQISDDLREVYRQLRLAQDKYAYFLLAAAGAAIGLALNQTRMVGLAWSQVPLGAAVVCWGLSFYFGCRHMAYVASILYSNTELLKVEGGQHPEVGANPQMIAAASEGIKKAIEDNSNIANRRGHLQFRLLTLGAVLYIAWHIWEMWLRT